MLTALSVLTCLGAAVIGGVFYAFSSFVMQALAQLPPAQGVAAMQRINVVVLNPPFLGLFGGTALLALVAAAVAAFAWSTPRFLLLSCGSLLYLWGVIGVTGRGNVPLNERLGRLDPAAPETAAEWTSYVAAWMRWNHLRTAAAVAAAACFAVAPLS